LPACREINVVPNFFNSMRIKLMDYNYILKLDYRETTMGVDMRPCNE